MIAGTNSVIYADHNGVEISTSQTTDALGIQYYIEHRSESGGFITTIEFQNGNPASVGINGFTNEHMLAILIDRVKRQDAKCPSEYNKSAIASMQAALQAFEARTNDRRERGITGTQAP